MLSRICTECDVWNYINGFYSNMLFNKIFGSNASKPWSKSQAKRLGALNKLKAGECNILVCTDVASRGLDIPLVGLVINYNIPPNPKVSFIVVLFTHFVIHPFCAHMLSIRVHFKIRFTYIVLEELLGQGELVLRSLLSLSMQHMLQSLMTRYEEAYSFVLRCFCLSGKKLRSFPAPEEEVLLLMERVSEVVRIAQMKVNEETGGKKKRGGDEGEDEVERYLKGKSFQKSKKRIR
ncbi:hypothetical protein RHGRI_009256 [Rhododendron griersonianum]|uniref:Helicase C-terminal domain-containing protein n=1 Tax=Rhododendron griersonianum TaxID=479676 RepID=A0AAV6L3K9_9ERIC|nr:hypothetical protein RHGRI_009256 [Rhododendron griersonianum]